jgi:hypothetical protein
MLLVKGREELCLSQHKPKWVDPGGLHDISFHSRALTHEEEDPTGMPSWKAWASYCFRRYNILSITPRPRSSSTIEDTA